MDSIKMLVKLSEEMTQEKHELLIERLREHSVECNLVYLADNCLGVEIKSNIERSVRDINTVLHSTRMNFDWMRLEGVEGIKYPIETIKSKPLLTQELEFENDNFNLENFYRNKLPAAVIVITKDKMISAYSWLSHGATALNIYNYLYNRDIQTSNWEDLTRQYMASNPEESIWQKTPVKLEELIWQDKARNIGNIIIQLSTNGSSAVWFPSKLNDFQYNILMGLVDHLTEVDERGNYQIELALDNNEYATPINEVKDKINEICRAQGLYDVPKAK